MKSWRDVIKIHPAAELFPLMAPEELKALGEDIKQNGLKHPIVLWIGGKESKSRSLRITHEDVFLLDGRNRLDAMELVGEEVIDDEYGQVEPYLCIGDDLDNKIEYVFEIDCLGRRHDPYAYAISANLRRRHLTAEQKREVTDKRLMATPELSDRAIAKEIEVDHKTVGARRKKLETTGEIPQLDKRVGDDGRARATPAEKPKRKAPAVAPTEKPTEPPQPQPSPTVPPPLTLKEASEAFFSEILKDDRLWQSGRTDLVEAVTRGEMSYEAALESLAHATPQPEIIEPRDDFDLAEENFRHCWGRIHNFLDGDYNSQVLKSFIKSNPSREYRLQMAETLREISDRCRVFEDELLGIINDESAAPA